GPQVQARSEISQLDSAMAAFKAKFGSYPPSRIRLCSSKNTYTATPSPNPQLDLDSIQYLQSMFPGLASIWSSQNVAWNASLPLPQDVTLTGDQCLVFFLGGIQTSNPNGTLGFVTGNNPAAVGSGGSV